MKIIPVSATAALEKTFAQVLKRNLRIPAQPPSSVGTGGANETQGEGSGCGTDVMVMPDQVGAVQMPLRGPTRDYLLEKQKFVYTVP